MLPENSGRLWRKFADRLPFLLFWRNDFPPPSHLGVGVLLGVVGWMIVQGGVSADQAKVRLSAEVVTPTNLYVPVEFTGWTVPFSRAVLYDTGEKRTYIQQELDDRGLFSLPFVLGRVEDEPKHFELFSAYKGLESRRLVFEFQPSTYEKNETTELVLPPLVDLSQREVRASQEVKLIAYACAGCEVVWTLAKDDGSQDERRGMTDDYGYMEVRLIQGISEGEYNISATARREGITSENSATLRLTVLPGDEMGMGSGTFGFAPGTIIISGLDKLFSGPLGTAFGILLFSWLAILLLNQFLNLIEHFHKLGIHLYLPSLGGSGKWFDRKSKQQEAEKEPPTMESVTPPETIFAERTHPFKPFGNADQPFKPTRQRKSSQKTKQKPEKETSSSPKTTPPKSAILSHQILRTEVVEEKWDWRDFWKK